MKDITPLRPPRAVHVEPPAHAPNAALMIDFDNVTLAIRSDLSAQLRKLLQSDIFKGKVSVQRAYADWRRYPQYIVPLSEASIDLIFAPAFGSNKKNATDIRLAIDALELVFTRPEIGTFILLSGDSDFSSLVLKLKEYAKYVIGVGIRESSSDLLVQNCDEYYSYSELTGLTKQTDLEYPHKDPWELVVEAVTHMKQQGDVMRSDRLKQVMQQLDGSFDEKQAGFSRFSKFVAEAGQRGLLKLTKQDNGQYEIDVGSNANVPPAVEAELAQRPAAPARDRTPRARQRAASASDAMTLAAAFHGLKETLAAMGGLENEVEAERVRDAMMQRSRAEHDPVFERARFQRLLRQAHDANLVELTKDDEGRYFLKLNPEALVEDQPVAGAAAAADAAEAAGRLAPIELGRVADAVRGKGIACFGPSSAAARLEGSKAFAKEGEVSDRDLARDAVHEGRAVGARNVEDGAGHPAAERHAEERRHEHDPRAHADFAQRKILAHDDGVRRHDAALEQAEEGRDHVERHETVEGQEEKQRDALQERAEEQGAQAADAVADPAGGEPADDASAEHDREHLGAARRAVAEVAAVGDDVDLRHRHRHAAGDAGDREQYHQGVGR